MDELIAEGTVDLLLPDTSLGVSLFAVMNEGKKIVQLDEAELYGSEFGSSERITLPTGQYYVRDRWPVMFYGRGPLAELLVELQLTEYVEFCAVSRCSLLLSRTTVLPLPLSKEEVMLESQLTLSEKRRLFKILKSFTEMPASPSSILLADWLKEKFEVDPESRLGQLIFYCVVRCATATEASSCLLSEALATLRVLESSVKAIGTGLVVCGWGSSELAQAAGRKAALNGAVQVMNRADCLRAKAELPRLLDFKVQISEEKKLYRWVFLMTGFLSGQCELFTVPPRSEVNDSDFSLNFLQLPSETGYCSSGLVLVSAWSEGPIPERVFEALLPGDAMIHQEIWVQRASEYSIDDWRQFHHQPLLPAHLPSEQQFVTSIKR